MKMILSDTKMCMAVYHKTSSVFLDLGGKND